MFIINLVTDFFADPSGVENSLPALRAAIVQMEETGGTLYIPPGNYRVESNASCLDMGAYIKQRGDWCIEGAGEIETILMVFPNQPEFNSNFFNLTAGFNTKITNLSLSGANSSYDPRINPWCNAIYVTNAVSENKRITLENLHFKGIWTYGFSKEGSFGNELTIRLKNIVFDKTLGSAISVFAGDNQYVTLLAERVKIKEAGLPGWNHGAYIHEHVSMHWDKCEFDSVSQYAIKYYSSGGTQTIKPRFAIIENCTFGANIQAAIAYHGPEHIILLSRNNTFNCLSFYYGFSIKSVDDTFIGSQCIVGSNSNSTWQFIRSNAINTKFRIASIANINGTRIIFDGCIFDNSYIEQTHAVENLDQTVIVRNLTSNHNNSDYLFRPLSGYWQIDSFWVTGTFNTAPWAAPLLNDYGSKVIRYSANDGYININRPAIVNRATGDNPLTLQNVDIIN